VSTRRRAYTNTLPSELIRLLLFSPEVLRCLMGYIIDLTLVMDHLFLGTLHIKPPRRLTADQVDMALENYKTSDSARVHQAIREYANRVTWGRISQSNNAQEKVIELINQHRGGAINEN
jgi:hypothetical protein